MATKTTSQTTSQQAVLWSRVLSDPRLKDLPFKVETNQYGQIVLSPHTPRHSFLQARISDLLRDHLQEAGYRAVEFAVETPKGVKVPDVVWISRERNRQIPEDVEASPVMPEICIEILSAGNTDAEISEKRSLYFEGGAVEVWTVDEDGTIAFYSPSGALPSSKCVASFPDRVEK